MRCWPKTLIRDYPGKPHTLLHRPWWSLKMEGTLMMRSDGAKLHAPWSPAVVSKL
jgi:hypothetical protein